MISNIIQNSPGHFYKFTKEAEQLFGIAKRKRITGICKLINIVLNKDFSNNVIEAAAESVRAEFVIEKIPGKPIKITDISFLK